MPVAFLTGGNRRESSIDPVGATEYPLPSNLKGDYSGIYHSSMYVDGDELLVAWVGPSREIRMARRLHCRAFDPSINLSTVTGTVFSAAWTLDSHNYTAIARCSGGYYHVAADMHAVPLKYMRSTTPGALDNWTSTMVGTQESSATYPQFIKAKSGVLYFLYRDGGSGDGDWILNKWNPTSATWSRVTTFIQGTIDNNSAYPHEVAVDLTTGRWHFIWTIRDSFIGIEYNHDICAAYSDDEGVTWRKYSNDAAYTLPITAATAEKVQTIGRGIDTGQSLYNGGQTASDASGRPQGVWLYQDAGGIFRYKHLWLDASRVWHWDTLLPTTNSSERLPAFVITTAGRRLMFFQNGSGNRNGTLRYYDLDTGLETMIRNANMLTYLPVAKYSADRNVTYLIAPIERQDGLLGGEQPDISNQANVPVIAVR